MPHFALLWLVIKFWAGKGARVCVKSHSGQLGKMTLRTAPCICWKWLQEGVHQKRQEIGYFHLTELLHYWISPATSAGRKGRCVPQVFAAHCPGSWERAEGDTHKFISPGNSSRGTRVQTLETLQPCCLELGTICVDVESISEAAHSPFLQYTDSCARITCICSWPGKGSVCRAMWVQRNITCSFVFGFTDQALSWFGSWGLEKHMSKCTFLPWWEAGLMPYYCNCQIRQSLQAVFKVSSSFTLCWGRRASLFWQCSQKSAWHLFILHCISGHPCSSHSSKVSFSVFIQSFPFFVVVWDFCCCCFDLLVWGFFSSKGNYIQPQLLFLRSLVSACILTFVIVSCWFNWLL